MLFSFCPYMRAKINEKTSSSRILSDPLFSALPIIHHTTDQLNGLKPYFRTLCSYFYFRLDDNNDDHLYWQYLLKSF